MIRASCSQISGLIGGHLPIIMATGPSMARVVIASHPVTPGWNKAGHPLPCGRSSATLLSCVFSSQHFSSYPASSRSDVP